MLSHMVSAAGNVESEGSFSDALAAGIEGVETELWIIVARLLTSGCS